MSSSVDTDGTSQSEASSASQGAHAAATSFPVSRRAARPSTKQVASTQKMPSTWTGVMDRPPNRAPERKGT